MINATGMRRVGGGKRPRPGGGVRARGRIRACVRASAAAALAACLGLAGPAPGQTHGAAAAAPGTHGTRSLADRSVEIPRLDDVVRVLALRDHNTRVVVLGTTMLGLAAGTIGTFALLRKRALTADALSHATLPGVCGAFMLAGALGYSGKALPVLLAGALVSGVIGAGCILAIGRLTRIKEDAALGIVLSVFFGLGVSLLGVIQKMGSGHAAGLESFIYGKTASMLTTDALLIMAAATGVALACALLFKEFTVLCFDPGFAASRGWPVVLLDTLMMALVVVVTVIGLQAVGLILVVALLIIPPAAARFWTDRLGRMLATAALIGGLSGYAGASLSALLPRLPAGAVIVALAGVLFGVSMLFGPARGVLTRCVERIRLERAVARQHLLRAVYERLESRVAGVGAAPAGGAELDAPVAAGELLGARSWSAGRMRRAVRAARRDGLVEEVGAGGGVRLTARGKEEARRAVRNHRLWEMYLIAHADIAPSHVDRDADQVEHVLGREMVDELEALLEAGGPQAPPPGSPHALAAEGATGSGGG